MMILDQGDLDFLLFDWLQAGQLADSRRFAGQSPDDWRAFLDLGQRLARDAFLPCWKASDRDEPQLSGDRVTVHPGVAAAVRAYLDAGLHLATVDEDHGGTGFPMVVTTAMMAWIMAANVSASGFLMLSTANARLIRDHGSPDQIARFATPQHEGRALGTMCLSEPDTGSALGDITTRAVPDGATYRLHGRKMWISAADHDVTPGITHLVLAKIANPDGSLPAGSRGISLFIVPAALPDGRPNDVTITGLNHKLGYRGIPNCAVAFGDGPGAVGELLGQPGQGLPIMFQMMNEARINVGLAGAALASRAYLLARDYARQRLQGRPLADKRAARPVPIIRHPDVRRMLLTQKALSEGALALCLYAARLVDQGAAGDSKAQALLDLLTPVVKSWPSEQGARAISLAIQVHGGAGYTRDVDVDQLWRDNRLNPIHEGTTGIQGLDLLGRKLLGDGLAGFATLADTMRQTEARAARHPDLAPLAKALAQQRQTVAAALAAELARDDAPATLAHGNAVLDALGHLVMGWIWLDMTACALHLGHPLAGPKLWTCRHYFETELPLIPVWLAPLATGSRLTTDIPEECL
ncbi:MAG: acyl-CoA dehydrogenase [Rhodobacterales bacterium]|jgi:alkylation response protein AidB-like acyl-CoA dehydrogenase